MSSLWFVLICLTAATVANAYLADFVKEQLSNHEVFQSKFLSFPYSSSIVLSDVLVQGQNNKKANLKGGIATYQIHSISCGPVLRPTDTTRAYNFIVNGKATCKFKEYVALNKKIGGWTSYSNPNLNSFTVTLDVSDCTVRKTSVVSDSMGGIGTCAACIKKMPIEMDKSMLYRVGDEVKKEVKVKINQALKIAAGSLNLKGSGLAGC